VTVTFGPRIADRWEPAQGMLHRGTVVVLPGRGEHGQVYERLGRRLAYDAYVVLAVDALPTTPVEELVALVREIQSPDRPLVLLGSDTGGLEALQIAVLAGDLVDAVVIAGLPGNATLPDWTDELEARTACPTHRQRLTNDDLFHRGGLDQPVPEALLDGAPFNGPVLVLHGDSDRITPLAEAVAVTDQLPSRRFVAVTGGRHDVLNDLSHRSVAAEIVQFLEQLRLGAGPVVTRLS
jgi:alpha-beta hydrolase superfamily lysophospholipase